MVKNILILDSMIQGIDKHPTQHTRQIAIIVVSILRTPEDDK